MRGKMKNNILVFIMCISVSFFIASSCWGDSYDFRKIKWGMSVEEVIATEPTQPVAKDKNSISYKTIVLNRNVSLIYRFINDKLIGATYQLDDIYIKTKSYIEAYDEFNNALSKKYGKPTNEGTIWLDNTYKNNPEKLYFALSAGHLQYFSYWLTSNSKIKTTLYGDFHNIIIKIDYISVIYEDIKKNKEEIIRDPF
jgi:hypothetical protein